MGRPQATVNISLSFSDLTHVMSPDMPVFPGEPEPQFPPIKTIAKDGANVAAVSFGSHAGTHVDAPSHFISGAAGVDELPPETFVGEAAILDVSSRQGTEVSAADLDARSGMIKKGDIVLLYTGTSGKWNSGRPDTDFAYLEPAAAEWIVGRGVKCVGIDSFSVEKYGSKDGLAHKHLLSNGVGIVENLSSDLRQFVGRRMFFVCLPLLLKGVDAAPARAVLFEITNGGALQ